MSRCEVLLRPSAGDCALCRTIDHRHRRRLATANRRCENPLPPAELAPSVVAIIYSRLEVIDFRNRPPRASPRAQTMAGTGLNSDNHPPALDGVHRRRQLGNHFPLFVAQRKVPTHPLLRGESCSPWSVNRVQSPVRLRGKILRWGAEPAAECLEDADVAPRINRRVTVRLASSHR
jgi:hypothetical protein